MPKKRDPTHPMGEPMIYITSSHPPEAENPKSPEEEMLLYVDIDD